MQGGTHDSNIDNERGFVFVLIVAKGIYG